MNGRVLGPTGFADESIEEVFVTDTPLECQPWGVGYSGCADLCVTNPFSPRCPDLIQLNPYLQPAGLRDDNPARAVAPAAQVPQTQQPMPQCVRPPERSFGSKVADAIVGFGDAFLIPVLVRNWLDIEGDVDYDSGAYAGGMITGTLWGSSTIAVQGTAAAGGTRIGHALNHNRHVRIGPGRWGKDMVPRISSPHLPGDGHLRLTSRLPHLPPVGALAAPGGCGE